MVLWNPLQWEQRDNGVLECASLRSIYYCSLYLARLVYVQSNYVWQQETYGEHSRMGVCRGEQGWRTEESRKVGLIMKDREEMGRKDEKNE